MKTAGYTPKAKDLRSENVTVALTLLGPRTVLVLVYQKRLCTLPGNLFLCKIEYPGIRIPEYLGTSS